MATQLTFKCLYKINCTHQIGDATELESHFVLAADENSAIEVAKAIALAEGEVCVDQQVVLIRNYVSIIEELMEFRSLTVNIDGSGSVPSTGVRARVSVPIACEVTGWVLVADASGSAVIDVLRSGYSGFPTTSSIAGTDKPTLSTVQKNENLGPLTNWGSTAIAAGDVLEFNLVSVTTCKLLSLTLNLTVP